MARLDDSVCGYKIHYSRHASYVVWNEFDEDETDRRSPITDTLEHYLKNLPNDFEPQRPIMVPGRDQKKLTQLVFAAEDPEDSPRHLLVLVVQPPVSEKTARPGLRPNCHWTTELYPAYTHNLVPISYEFAMDATPAKRLNFIVGRNGCGVTAVAEAETHTGFLHFVSAAYSRNGIALIDFLLTLPPIPSENEALFRDSPFHRELAKRLQRQLTPPLRAIRDELYKDQNTLAPPELRNLDAFFDDLVIHAADTGYANLAVFQREINARINPGAERYAIAPIVSEEEARGNSDYFRTLYQQAVLEGNSIDMLSQTLNVKKQKLEDDLTRLRRTLRHSGRSQADFLAAVEGFRGYELTLNE